jgi:hypothetical protein
VSFWDRKFVLDMVEMMIIVSFVIAVLVILVLDSSPSNGRYCWVTTASPVILDRDRNCIPTDWEAVR